MCRSCFLPIVFCLLCFLAVPVLALRRPPSLKKEMCFLPLGDSLTQGVGKHGSYRRFLFSRIVAEFPSCRIHTAGSQQFPCTMKQPGVPWTADPGPVAVSWHEGHCSWGSGALVKELAKLVGEGKAMWGACQRVPDAVLLMVGHNDAFQIAKLCKIKEEERPGNAAKEQCARKHFEYFRTNLNEIIDVLISARTDDTTPIYVFWGLNPPTGFPLLDPLLHETIEDVAANSSRRVSSTTVRFSSSWKKFEHTFDTTHPNAKGAQLLAEGWFSAISDSPLLKPCASDGTEDEGAFQKQANLNNNANKLESRSVHRVVAPHLLVHDSTPQNQSDGSTMLYVVAFFGAMAIGCFWVFLAPTRKK